MTGKLLTLAVTGAAADLAAGAGRDVDQLLQQAAATITALTVLVGGLWWLIGPRVRAYLKGQAAAAQQVDLVANQLPAAHSDLADRLARVEAVQREGVARLGQVEGQLHDHLVMASTETRLVSELLIRAADDDRDHHHHREDRPHG